MKTIKIGDRLIGDNLAPYMIAEVGVNHECSMDLAKKLIDEAASGGAHAVKFQSYKANKIASRNSPSYWDLSEEPTDSQYALFQKYDSFGPDEYEQLCRHCGEAGVDFMSTPFDLEAADYLEPLMPAFKIASADITNVPLIRKVAKYGKPVLLSTGASTLPEIENAVNLVRAANCTDIVLLHCVLNYPTRPENAQLGMIEVLRRVFPDCLTGYSDHVVPDATLSPLEAAMLLGASVLEKHFTHDKSLKGNDHYHAMDHNDLKAFFAKARVYKELVGGGNKDIELEASARKNARRSIVAARDIMAGEVLTEENMIVKRPGHGISPLYWDEVIGSKATCEIKEDQILNWTDVLLK